MSDLKAYLTQIETVDDYFKFKDTFTKNPPSGALKTSKALGTLADFYDDPNSKPKSQKEIPKQFQSDFELPLYKDNYLSDSNFLSNYKENMIPFELKEGNKLSRLSDIKVFGNEASNESMVENSFLKQLNLKNFNLKNMFEAEKPKTPLLQEPKSPLTQEPTKYPLKAVNYNVLKAANPYEYTALPSKNQYDYNALSSKNQYDYSALSSKYSAKSLTNSNNSNIYNKFKAPERPDSNYIDNNDIRAYLSSLDSKLVTENKSQTSESQKSRSVSENPKRKLRNKNRKMDLSIIEDEFEDEEHENRPMKKSKKHRKQEAESSGSDSRKEMVSKGKNNKRKHEKNKYEEDLTRNYSEKDLSLHSASHFNENYKRNKNIKDFSETSLPSKAKEQEYLKKKYGKELPNEEEIMLFLDNISEVICVNCNEMIDLNTVDEHSFECFKAINQNLLPENVSSLNSKMKQIVYLLKKKLKNIKEYINKHEDSNSQHFYFNYTLMIIECLQQIINNDQIIVKLVSNIKDINAFNKSLYENDTPLSKFILSITYRIKPLAKLKIPCIDPKMTWSDAKNLREKSIISQNYSKNESKSQAFRESIKEKAYSMRESYAGSKFLINANNTSMMKSNCGDVEDGLRREFTQMVVSVKLTLDRNHPGRFYKIEELYNEVRRMKMQKEQWGEFVERKFNEMSFVREN